MPNIYVAYNGYGEAESIFRNICKLIVKRGASVVLADEVGSGLGCSTAGVGEVGGKFFARKGAGDSKSQINSVDTKPGDTIGNNSTDQYSDSDPGQSRPAIAGKANKGRFGQCPDDISTSTPVTSGDPPRGDASAHILAGISIGGDGTFLRLARALKDTRVPLFGVNMGRVGFLAETEPEDAENLVESILTGQYTTEERAVVTVDIQRNGERIYTEWALNEITIERQVEGKVIDIEVYIDGCKVINNSCNGIVVSSATGSTAYSFSAGGPIVWPTVGATLIVLVAPHGSFARPVVVPPECVILLRVISRDNRVVLCGDGQVRLSLQSGDEVICRGGSVPVVLGRVQKTGFAKHLVRKFNLPVNND